MQTYAATCRIFFFPYKLRLNDMLFQNWSVARSAGQEGMGDANRPPLPLWIPFTPSWLGLRAQTRGCKREALLL